MKRFAIFILLTALLIPAATTAQRKKNSSKKQKKETVEEDPRIQQMLASTQQIIFIDSIVVNKTDLLQHIPLSPDCGKLSLTNGLAQYTNEMGDYRLTAVKEPHDSVARLFSSELIGKDWTAPVKASGIDSGNYPYMLPDGTTLYFAQQGEKSIGGYDLFVTRYDAESGTFLRPENLGMPFNSEANDYFYIIDETYQLGYFATDRRQPAGKVCIYVFIPTDSRKTYVAEAYSDSQLRALAAINRIADTWGDGQAREEAMQRWTEAQNRAEVSQSSQKRQNSELEEMRHKASVLEKALLLTRNYYAKANEKDRSKLRDEILSSERELEQLQRDIRQKEKEEHNAQYKDNN